MLTKAWIDSLEQVSVLGESPVKVPHTREGVPSPAASHRHGEASPLPGARNSPPAVPTLPMPGAPWQAASGGSGLTMLSVPSEFDGVRGGVLQSPLAKDTESGSLGIPPQAAQEQRQCLQACLRAFTRSLLRGITVSVMLDDGCTCLAEARMDSELTHLVLHVPNAQHPVALKSIESVSLPDESWLPQVQRPHMGQVDLCCVTLIIEGGQFLTLVFDSPRTREYFEVCLKVLILARESNSPASRQPTQQRFTEAPNVLHPRNGDDGPFPTSDRSPESSPGESCSTDHQPYPTESEPPLPEPSAHEACMEDVPTRV